MEFRKVAFIRFSAIGDILLTTPILRFFYEQYPQCEIHFVVRQAFADLLRFHPLIQNLIIIPDRPGIQDLRLTRAMLRRGNYDAIFDLQKHWRSYFVSLGLGSRVFRYRKYAFRRFLLVHGKWNLYGQVPEKIPLRYFQVFRNLHWRWRELPLELFWPDEVEERADDLLKGVTPGMLIAVAPGAGRATKRWPAERFASVAADLAQKVSAHILLLGSDADAETCERCTLLPKEVSVVNLCGKTSLLETASILKRCQLLLTNDTGLMHMAMAVNTPVVAVFGPTVREFGFFPFGRNAVVIEQEELGCRPCSYHGTATCPEGHFRCMTDIEPGRVLEAALNLLQNS